MEGKGFDPAQEIERATGVRVVANPSEEVILAALSSGERKWQQDDEGPYWSCPQCGSKERVRIHSCGSCSYRPATEEDEE